MPTVVRGLRAGPGAQGRAGGTGTGIKQLSLLRMWGRIHGYTTPQVGCWHSKPKNHPSGFFQSSVLNHLFFQKPE